ncbi:hypothetical protein WA026_018534 [Henosepilachna vigintioctopunctata]|uniref:Uncharacterized protein n=1 Tax=Henosepilachna vigintioctopunctata TaxID=420089 RepID=A0AAW1U0R1_9CUCU
MYKQIIFLFAVLIHTVISKDQNKYTTMYDNIDLKEVVENERLLKNYVDCLLEEGRCTPDGAELRKNLPDAIENDCERCTEKQKEGSNFMMRYLIDNKPEYWNRLQAKYDPTDSYKKKYLQEKEVTFSVTKIETEDEDESSE